jgi:hypothetical protein
MHYMCRIDFINLVFQRLNLISIDYSRKCMIYYVYLLFSVHENGGRYASFKNIQQARH